MGCHSTQTSSIKEATTKVKCNSANLLFLPLKVALSVYLLTMNVFGQVPKPNANTSQPIANKGELVAPGRGTNVSINLEDGSAVTCRMVASTESRIFVVDPCGVIRDLPLLSKKESTAKFVPLTPDELAKKLVAREYRGFLTATTKHFVFIYNCSPQFQRGVSAVLESELTGLVTYCKNVGLAVQQPEFPLVVVLYATEKELRESHPDFSPSVVAAYSVKKNSVVMFEEGRLAKMTPEIALKSAISTIAHEGCHQILANIGVENRLSIWPAWVSEGIAEYFAPTTLAQGVRWKGAGTVNDLRIWELLEHSKANPRQPSGEILKKMIEAQRLTSLDYARAWGTCHYLVAAHRESFWRMVKDLSQLGPYESVAGNGNSPSSEANRKHFIKYFGTDFGAEEGYLTRHVLRQNYVDPWENQTHYVGVVSNSDIYIHWMSPSPFYMREWIDKKLEVMPGGQVNVQAFPSFSAAKAYRDGL